MASSVRHSVHTDAQTLPRSYIDAVKCLQQANVNENNNSKSMELLPFHKEGTNGYPIIIPPKFCSEVRLPPALCFHRNSDPLLHRRSQVRKDEEMEKCCQTWKKKRRQSDKGPVCSRYKNDLSKCSVCCHFSPQNKTDSSGLCNGGIPGSIKLNGSLHMSDRIDSPLREEMVDDYKMDIINNLLSDVDTDHRTERSDGPPLGVVISEYKSEKLNNPLSDTHTDYKVCEQSIDRHSPRNEPCNNCYSCSSAGINTLSSDLIVNGELEEEVEEDEPEPEVISIDLQPHVMCNGELLTSFSEQDIETAEKQPFLERENSGSGSESNNCVKHSLSWQKPRHALSDSVVDQTQSLPNSIERHPKIVKENSNSSFSNCRPLSGISSRSCSPQPGPSGCYNGVRPSKKTVRISQNIGSYRTIASEDSSQSLYQNSVSEENLRQLDREIRELERVGKKADRGTIYCACGVLGIVLGVLLFFIYLL